MTRPLLEVADIVRAQGDRFIRTTSAGSIGPIGKYCALRGPGNAAAFPGRAWFSRGEFSGKDSGCWWHRLRSRHFARP
jgi:hypothetical protein